MTLVNRFKKPTAPHGKLAIVLLTVGLLWSFYSDSMISAIEKARHSGSLDLLRGINNILIFGITALIFYLRVRKQQHRLILSEQQYRSLFDSNPNPMWIYHKKTLAFIAVNEAAVAKYGYSRNEFLSMSIRNIRPESDYELLNEALKCEQEGIAELGAWRHLRKSGEIFPVSVVSHDVWFNQQSCKMVMATDITQIVRNEQMLREGYLKEKELREELAVNYEQVRKSELENRLMAHVIDKINNLVLIVKEDGLISWVNRAFTDFTGYTPAEAIGRRPSEIILGPKTDPEAVARLQEAVRQKNFFNEELINYKKSGEVYWTQLAISPIYDEQNRFQFFMSVETVVTERKEKEQKIMAQHAALQKIAWSNSHELRRPVCLIIGLISVLKEADNDKDRNECLAALETCTRELDDLVRNINQKTDHLEMDESLVR